MVLRWREVVKMDFSNYQLPSNSQLPIGKKKLEPIANRLLGKRLRNFDTVDKLLEEYSELIVPSYKPWFADRFYDMPLDTIRRCASEAKADGKDPKRLFSFLIRKRSAANA